VLARFVFSLVNFASRKGLADSFDPGTPEPSAKSRARQTGVRGETYAYWYLRRHGYILVARNYRFPGVKGEVDLVGYDGPVLAFVEVKTRSSLVWGNNSKKAPSHTPAPEYAVDSEKRRNLIRMAAHYLRMRRVVDQPYRFDILAIEASAARRPVVRLHKGAFTASLV
jgi:putative endonuclease